MMVTCCNYLRMRYKIHALIFLASLDYLESSDFEIVDIKYKINQALSVLDTVIEKLKNILPIAGLLNQNSPEEGLNKILELLKISKQHPTVLKYFDNPKKRSKRIEFRDLYNFLCSNVVSFRNDIAPVNHSNLIDVLEMFKLRMGRNMRLLGQFEQQKQDYLQKVAKENELVKEKLEGNKLDYVY
jgi:hypothetical protein